MCHRELRRELPDHGSWQPQTETLQCPPTTEQRREQIRSNSECYASAKIPAAHASAPKSIEVVTQRQRRGSRHP